MSQRHKYDLHIGESTWDFKCLELHGYLIKKSFLHNDYFNEDVSSLVRLNRFCIIFFLVFRAVIFQKKIIFTSINSDSMLVQLIFGWYRKAIFVLPNLLGYKQEKNFGARLYRSLIKIYKQRVIATDQITYHCLKDYSISIVERPFKLNLPTKWTNDYSYLVIFPTPGTHKDLKKASDKFFKFYLELFDILDQTFSKVFIVTHPRDRGETLQAIRKLRKNYQLYTKKIANQNLESYDPKNTVYISGLSSLCLNRRYGANFGVLCSIDGKNILKNEFREAKLFLTDILDVVQRND